MQHKAKLAPRPPSGPLRYQLCHMGPFLARGTSRRCEFCFEGPPVKGEARHVWCASTVLLCNHVIKKKVLMYERYGVVFLLRWLSARQRVCSWFLRISSGMERDSSQVAEIQSSFSR